MDPDEFNNLVDQVVEILQSAQRLFFITGAGMSADSGLPTYRGVAGLYNETDTEDGMSIEQALSGSTFLSRPDLTWKYLAQIAKSAQSATFNRGHEIITAFESSFEAVTVLTQNVDGFHTLAGSSDVIEIHGNIRKLHCTQCEHTIAIDKFPESMRPPRCEKCNAFMRPSIVLFDEMLPLDALERFSACMRTHYDAVFTIGTSSVFPYIIEPVVLAKEAGIPTIEINPSTTSVTDLVEIKIRQWCCGHTGRDLEPTEFCSSHAAVNQRMAAWN